jgi:hypothetical protein
VSPLCRMDSAVTKKVSIVHSGSTCVGNIRHSQSGATTVLPDPVRLSPNS